MYWMQAAWTLFALYGGSANRTTIPNLSRSRLASFAVPSPPLPEQQEIARILQAVDRKIAAEEARKQALEALFTTLLQQLMTGEVRVNCVEVQDGQGETPTADQR
jgi:type I restriction enzyme S subunit